LAILVAHIDRIRIRWSAYNRIAGIRAVWIRKIKKTPGNASRAFSRIDPEAV
jgi:hypothetical protein